MRKKELSIRNVDDGYGSSDVVIEHPTFTVTIADNGIRIERADWDIVQINSSVIATAPDVTIQGGVYGSGDRKGTTWTWYQQGKGRLNQPPIRDISDRQPMFTTVPKPKPRVGIGQSPVDQNASVWYATREDERGNTTHMWFPLNEWADAVRWALDEP